MYFHAEIRNKKILSGHSTYLLLPLWANSADGIFKYFSYVSQKTGFDSSCKLSPMETVCMKCQILFSGEKKNNKKNISKCHLLKILPRVQSEILKYFF